MAGGAGLGMGGGPLLQISEAEWEIEAEHRATGARLCWRGMSAAGYRDGLIVWWREYWNPADLTPSSGRR